MSLSTLACFPAPLHDSINDACWRLHGLPGSNMLPPRTPTHTHTHTHPHTFVSASFTVAMKATLNMGLGDFLGEKWGFGCKSLLLYFRICIQQLLHPCSLQGRSSHSYRVE